MRAQWLALSACLFAWTSLSSAQIASVTPRVDCTQFDPATGYAIAYFGYININAQVVTIPVGLNNFFLQFPLDKGQPTSFQPGNQYFQFSTLYQLADGLTWGLDNGYADASSSSELPVCPATLGPPQFPPISIGTGQTLRVTATSTGPGTCQATLGFAHPMPSPLQPADQFTLAAGQSTYLDLPGSTVVSGTGRADVQPIVTGDCLFQAEAFDSASTITATSMKPETPQIQPVFPPIGLSNGQTLRLHVAAYTANSCNVAMGFADPTGAAVGPTSTVNLNNGQMAHLDLPSTLLPALSGWTGKREELRPVVTNVVTLADTANNSSLTLSACLVSAEIFDTIAQTTRIVVTPDALP